MKKQEERKENFINMRKRKILKLFGVFALCSSAFISTKCALDKGIMPKVLTQENEIKKGLKKSYDNADFISVDFPSAYSTCIKQISFINTMSTTIQFYVNEIDYQNYYIQNRTTFTLSNYYNNRQYDYFALVLYNMNDYKLYATALYYDYQPFNNSFTMVESVQLLNINFNDPIEIAFQLPSLNSENEMLYKINNKSFNALLDINQISQEFNTNFYGNFLSYYATMYETNKRNAQELQQQVNSLNTQLHNLQSQYNNLQTQYSNLQTQYSNLQNDYQNLQTQFDVLDSQVSNLQRQVSQLNEELETARNTITTQHNQIVEQANEINRLNTRVGLLEEEIEQKEEEIEQLNAQIEELQSQLELNTPNNIMQWLKLFLNTVEHFLNIEILPYVKVSYIVAMPILFGVISLFIKLVRGA